MIGMDRTISPRVPVINCGIIIHNPRSNGTLPISNPNMVLSIYPNIRSIPTTPRNNTVAEKMESNGACKESLNLVFGMKSLYPYRIISVINAVTLTRFNVERMSLIFLISLFYSLLSTVCTQICLVLYIKTCFCQYFNNNFATLGVCEIMCIYV